MFKFLIITLLLLPEIVLSQRKGDATTSLNILTQDIDNFWKAYDELGKCNNISDSLHCIKECCFENGSAGFKEFIAKYQFSPNDYIQKLKQFPRFFKSIRNNTNQVKTIESEIKMLITAIRNYYPDYKPKQICFVISPLECGGTTTDSSIFVGAEIITSTKEIDLSEFGESIFSKVLSFDTNIRERLVFTIAHEMVHDLQINAKFDDYSLLNKSINEGSADFVANYITGIQANNFLYEYGNQHEHELWLKFKADVEHNENTDNWMYNFDRVENDVPADLGYYMGYKIVESYFNNCSDKKQSILDIIEIANPKEFLIKSKYEKKY